MKLYSIDGYEQIGKIKEVRLESFPCDCQQSLSLTADIYPDAVKKLLVEKLLGGEMSFESTFSIVPDYYNFFGTDNLAIKKVIFNPPATIVLWRDGTKTVVKCKEGDQFDKWAGFSLCISKKIFGKNFHRVFKKWCDKEEND